jgi:DNA processing protein
LAARILERGGLLLSEYPPGTSPRKGYFPARNRIIAALSRGVLIVEAPGRSGALITARLALEQNRDLWVASGGLGAEGTQRLAGEGAPVISSGGEILRDWGILPEPRTEEAPPELPFSGTRLAASLARELNIKL